VTEQDGKRDFVRMRWGPCAALVVEATERVTRRNLQRARRDRRDEAILSRCVQAHAVPDPDVRILRVAEHAERKAALVLHGSTRDQR
jgi:hypothetical protein